MTEPTYTIGKEEFTEEQIKNKGISLWRENDR